MVAGATVACPMCGAPDDGGATCLTCGLLLRCRDAAPAAVADLPLAAPARPPSDVHVADPHLLPRPAGPVSAPDRAWPYLAAGAVLAPCLTLAPILRYMGWFLASLVHETGHCVASWSLGCPAFPAIRLDGHAAAVHGPQSLPLVLLVWCGIVALSWRLRERRAACAALAAGALLQPLLAFTRAREGAFLVAGHLGEIAFGAVFLWRAGTGGFTSSRAERGLYGVLGWFLVGRNAWLAAGLAWSDQAKATYAGNGSFGMENDDVRLSREVLGWPTETVALAMLLVAVAAPAVAWGLARRRGGE